MRSGRKGRKMKFMVTLTDEASEVIGSYSIDVVNVIVPEQFENDVDDGCLIDEKHLDSPKTMTAHGQYLGELILSDVKAIYSQRSQ